MFKLWNDNGILTQYTLQELDKKFIMINSMAISEDFVLKLHKTWVDLQQSNGKTGHLFIHSMF